MHAHTAADERCPESSPLRRCQIVMNAVALFAVIHHDFRGQLMGREHRSRARIYQHRRWPVACPSLAFCRIRLQRAAPGGDHPGTACIFEPDIGIDGLASRYGCDRCDTTAHGERLVKQGRAMLDQRLQHVHITLGADTAGNTGPDRQANKERRINRPGKDVRIDAAGANSIALVVRLNQHGVCLIFKASARIQPLHVIILISHHARLAHSPPQVTRRMSKRASQKVVLIPGDGIGPEITDAVLAVLDAAEVKIDWVRRSAGVAALGEGLDVLPEATIEAIELHKVALKGPCTTPVGDGFSSVNVQLRKQFDLYAAVRPVRSLAGVSTRYEDVDLIIIRENTEGLYSGVENEIVPGVVMSMKVATENGCLRIAQWAYRFATQRQRKKITVFHKANIMKMTDGLFLRASDHVHKKEYPNIEYETAIIDAGCMRLVQDPSQFDILLLENLYGDVISDLCAGLVGGLGVVPGANYGENKAIFEAVHGSAPDIAGKNVANPLALLMSAVMMLNYLAEDNPAFGEAAVRIRDAYDQTLLDGQKTRDLGGNLNTDQFAQAVIDRL